MLNNGIVFELSQDFRPAPARYVVRYEEEMELGFGAVDDVLADHQCPCPLDKREESFDSFFRGVHTPGRTTGAFKPIHPGRLVFIVGGPVSYPMDGERADGTESADAGAFMVFLGDCFLSLRVGISCAFILGETAASRY